MGPAKKSKSKKRALASKKEGDPERERPPPPPPPPASLVKLLQKDSSVLRYFQSLQENLDYDVLKWKSRARFQEQQARELAAKLEETNQKTMEMETGIPPNHSLPQHNTSSSPPTNQDKPPSIILEADKKEPPRSERPKEESDFELEFSSSDDDDQDQNQDQDPATHNVPSFGIHKKKSRSMDLSSSSSSASSVSSTLSAIDWKDSSNHQARHEKKARYRMIPLPSRSLRNDILAKLAQAQTSLLDLGIPLVADSSPDGTTVDEKGSSDMDDDSGDVVKEASASNLCRRSDQDVIIDILACLRDLARINVSTDQTRYSPFMAPNFLPCFEPKGSDFAGEEPTIPHPAIAGMEAVLSALCVMDAFGSTLDQLDADPTFVPNEKESMLLLGMRHRHDMVANLIQSLEGEMVECWPVNDRSIRIQSTATHVKMDTRIESDKETAASDERVLNNSFHAKSFVRLVALAERCMHAKFVIGVLLFRGDYHRAFQLFWSYFLATVPSILIEDYPKLQPVQSLCVVDILLFTNKPTLQAIQGSPGSSLGEWIMSTDDSDGSFVSGIHLVMAATAAIFELRNGSDLDCRVVDISRIELAAFQRLQTKFKSPSDTISWPSTPLQFPNDFVSKAEELVLEERHHASFVSALALVLNGSVMFINQDIEKCLQGDLDCLVDLLWFVKARCQWEIRQLDMYRAIVALPTTVSVNPEEHKEINATAQSILRCITSKALTDLIPDVVKGAIHCLKELGDAECMYRLCLWLKEAIPDNRSFDSQLCKVLDEADVASDSITVRVINLKRRPDRYAAFISQALAQKVLVLKGVAPLSTDTSKESNTLFGFNAIDGKGINVAEVVQQLQDFSGGSQTDLDRLVLPKWVPGDLRPFDSEAPETDDMVAVSNTEKACALSHVGAWYGVIRTLDLVGASPGPMLPHHKVLIGGFARGPPLDPKNEDMQPTPVCVILEDDAILVDRFVDRLEVLLEELPRDFHFCSIGYGRPKKAPLVPFSSHLSVPTAIWYLTGYILSLEGARHLVNKLPVRGPVDSWIGLAIFSNWDNTIGHGLGVGVSSKVSSDTNVSIKSLRTILRFRAFAATIPLCSQKVGNVPGSAVRSGWRHRDTDIEYSGNNPR